MLPAISTDLVELKGSRLTEALVRAEQMLAAQPKDSSRHLLLITDGEFGDAGHEEYIKRLSSEGVHLHVLAIGTAAGGPVPGEGNTLLYHQNGTQVISRLDEQYLKQLAEIGNGIYQLADYRGEDTDALLGVIGKVSHAEVVADQKTRIWNEHFFWFVGLAMLLVMPMFRRFPRVALDQEAP